MVDLLLCDATLPDGSTGINVAIHGGRIVGRGPAVHWTARECLSLGGRLLSPAFVEPHLHLDVALMNAPDRPGRPEPYQSLAGLNQAMERRRLALTPAEIEARAGLAIRRAVRHGVTALRAQCHVDLTVGLKHLQALLAVKERYAEVVTLQIVAFPQQGLLAQPGTLDLFREAFRLGADVMGCASNLDRGVAFRDHIDAAFALARKFDVDLDAHVDLTLPDRMELNDLEVVHLARRTLEYDYQGRVTAGHVCALDSVLPGDCERAIALIRAADLNVVSQPDLYRLGRDEAHHVRRGLTRVRQLLAAGVNVTYASNNVRDAFRPLGNFDPVEEGLVLAYGAHLDTVEELETLLSMCTYHAARTLRLPDYGLAPGCRADLVVLDASAPSAVVADQAEKLYVIGGGRLLAANSRRNDCYLEPWLVSSAPFPERAQ